MIKEKPFEITHIKFSKKSIGIAWSRLKCGWNYFIVTYRNIKGKVEYPGVYRIHRENDLKRFGPVTTINGNGLKGLWVPLLCLSSMKVEGLNE